MPNDEYWLVYLFHPDDYRWTAVGLVEERDTWREWWGRVMGGEIDLPEQYDGWWCADRPVSVGLPDA